MARRRVLGLAAGLLACVVVSAWGAATEPPPTTLTDGPTTGRGPAAAQATSSVTAPTAVVTGSTTDETGPATRATAASDMAPRASVTETTSSVTGPPTSVTRLTTAGDTTTSEMRTSNGAAGPTTDGHDVTGPPTASTGLSSGAPSEATLSTTHSAVTEQSADSGQATNSVDKAVETQPTDGETATDSNEPTTDGQRSTTDESSTAEKQTAEGTAVNQSGPTSTSAEPNASRADDEPNNSPAQLEIVIEESTEVDGDPGTPASVAEVKTSSSTPTATAEEHPAPDLADSKDSRDLEDAYHNEVPDDVRRKYKLSHPFLIGTRTAAKDESSSTSSSPSSGRSFVLYRNYDVDSQERERELEERAREQNHPADLEDTNVHEVNHYVPEDEHGDDPEAAEKAQQQQQRSVARWYLLLLSGNATTVRLRQKDFAKYLKLNLAARLSVEYNDLRVNRVEFKPLLMVNVTIFSRPKDNEEAPLHMLADTNATLLELSGEEYHVVRFITIPNDEALASLASGGFQADSYTGAVPPRAAWHVDMGVAVYFAIAAALVSILLAVFLVGLWRYLRALAAEVQWPWRRYKPYSLPRWSLPLQHRLCADHIVHHARPLHHVWTTADDVPVQKILAPEPPHRLVLTSALPHLLGGEPAPSTADTLLQTQPAPPPAAAATAAAATAPSRPNSKLSLFGAHCEQVLQPDRPALGSAAAGRHRLQPQGRHPLDVRIGPTVLGLDNPNYMLQ